VPLRNDLARVLVAQLVERKGAALGPGHARGQPIGRIQQAQAQPRTQVGLGVGLQRRAGLGHAAVQARGLQHIEQRLARTRVHAHIAHGQYRQPGERGQVPHHAHPLRIVRAAVQRQRQRRAVAEPLLQPGRTRVPNGQVGPRLHHQQHQAARQPGQERRLRHLAFDVGHPGFVGALGGTAPRHGDPARQVDVAAVVLHQHRQAHARQRRRPHPRLRIDQPELRPHHQVQATLARLRMRPHHPRQRALVGHRQRRIAALLRTIDQLMRMRRPAQEAEVAAAQKLGIGRQLGRMGTHVNAPTR